MFRCERCGSGFSPIRVAANETCPRCRARDGVSARLSFAPFSAIGPEADEGAPQEETSRDKAAAQAESRRRRHRGSPG
jgi:hypothetical protein